MGETDLTPASTLQNIIRGFFSMLDRAAFALLGVIYQIFFNVASADIFYGNTIMRFYSRVQLILGVFMIFQLAMTILKGIVDPDTFTDKKSGAGSFVTKVATGLILLAIMMPISISSPKNEYEKQINNNGLLFGTLYSLQHRILANNTIGKLVLGTNDDSASYMTSTSSSTGKSELEKSARIFTSTILKAFYRINLLPEDQRTKHEDGKDDSAFNDNRVCKSIDDSVLETYYKADADPSDIISMINFTCSSTYKPGFFNNLVTTVQTFTGSTYYIFVYHPIVSFIVALVFVVLFFSFTIDVALRAVKLAVLRLIAPIPVISYMNPNGGKDGAFNAWVKSLTSTYLDLFIRLASVYFVIFIIQEMINGGVAMNVSGGSFVGILSFILIWIGLFAFARQAPKFIKEALGIKADSGRGLFSGLGEIGNALGLGAAALGGFGAFRSSMRASRAADIANHGEAYAKNPLNRGKHLLAGIAGGVGGLATGMGAAFGAKDHANRAVIDALQKRNAEVMARGGVGSTAFGRAGANVGRVILGDTGYDEKTRDIAQKKAIETSSKDLFSYLEGKGKTDGANYRVTTADVIVGQDAAGHDIEETFTGTLNEFNRLKAEALSKQQRGIGNGEFTFDGKTINANDQVVSKIEEELAFSAGDRWAREKGEGDGGFVQKRDTYNEAVKGAKTTNPKAMSLYKEYDNGSNGHTASKLKKTSKTAGGEALRGESDAIYKRQKANYGATDKK